MTIRFLRDHLGYSKGSEISTFSTLQENLAIAAGAATRTLGSQQVSVFPSDAAAGPKPRNNPVTLSDDGTSLVSGAGNVLDSALDLPAGRARFANSASGAAYGLSYNRDGTIARAGKQAPWLYQDSNGPTQWLHQTAVRGVAIGFGGKIYAISSQDRKCHVYSAGVWTIASSAIDAGSGIFNTLFADSRGYLFASWASNGGSGGQKLYRSIDGGVNWTTVLSSSDMTDADDYAHSMTEDNLGYLYCTSYNTVDTPATKALFKSIDGGATWSNIYSAISAVNNYPRHMHCVYWDRHRNALWVSGGDGAPYAVCVSTDRGVTFTAWSNSFQATALLADADYVYYCADIAGDHSIYRAAGTTVAEILASTPRNVLKIGSGQSPVAPFPSANGTEFSWWGAIDADGNIAFPYGKGAQAFVAMSSDQGASWTDGLAGSSVGITQWSHEPVFPSDYVSGHDGYYYGVATGTRYARRWRTYSGGCILDVNSATGDDAVGNGVSKPFATVPESGVLSNARLRLTADYTKNAALSLPGLILDRGDYTLGVADSGTLTVNETFEGTSTLTTATSGAATVSQTSTTNPWTGNPVAAGTRAARCTTSGGGSEVAMVLLTNGLQSAASGDYLWMSGWFYLTAASVTAQCIIMQFQNGVNIGVDLTSGGGGLAAQTSTDSKQFRQHLDDMVAFPLNEYVYIKARVLKHATAGRITVWQNGRQVQDILGVNTNGSGITSPRWGAVTTQAVTMDVDSVKASVNFDPDQPPAYKLNGVGQLLIPDMEVTPLVRPQFVSVTPNTGAVVDRGFAGQTDRQWQGSISSAQLLALNATPVQLIPAPPPGKATILLGIQFYKAAGTAYAGIAAGEDLAVRYTNASGAIVAECEATGFLDQTTAQTRYVYPVAAAAVAPIADVTPAAAAALVLHLLVGEITTGNSPLLWRAWTRTVDTAWA